VPGFSVPPTFRGLPSHGIGLSPDQRFLWLVDKPNRAVHEFDISGLPHRPPVMIATVHVSGPNLGWLNLSRDGRYLFAGDAGNVINTQTRTTVARMGALVGSRYNIGSTRPAPACARRTHANHWATCTSRRSAASLRAEPPGALRLAIVPVMGPEIRVGRSDYGRVVVRSVSLGSSRFPRGIFVRGAERRSAMATATGQRRAAATRTTALVAHGDIPEAAALPVA
jgi:hypothetical protein